MKRRNYITLPIEVISKGEERELLLRAKEDIDARNRLVMGHFRFIFSEAYKYYQKFYDLGVEFADLLHEAVLGFIKAIENYDPVKGKNSKFITYASWWIKASVEGFVKKYEILDGDGSRVVYLDDEYYTDGGVRYIDVIKGSNGQEVIEENLIKAERAKVLNDYITRYLTQQEIFVLVNYFGLNGQSLSLREIASIWGTSSEWVRQVKDRAIDKLRKLLDKEEI